MVRTEMTERLDTYHMAVECGLEPKMLFVQHLKEEGIAAFIGLC